MSTNETHLCVLCNSKLESKEALKDHFRKHANKEIDGKGRPVTATLQGVPKLKGKVYEKGSASKLINGLITCDVCGEKFNCNTTAIQHKFRKHPSSSSRFHCPECGMQFVLQSNRDDHLASHQQHSQGEVSCNICRVTFYNDAALKYHSDTAHERVGSLFQPVMTPPPSNKIKVNNAGEPQSVYYCHLCGFEYIVKFNLQKHLEKQHSKEERDSMPADLLKCTTCDALFYSQKAYTNHNMYHRPNDLYVTSEQQRLQTVTRVDQDFDIRRVLTGADKYVLNSTRRKRKRNVPEKKQESKTKPVIDDSYNDMSPPSAMDTSSESESDEPLQKRLATTDRVDHQIKKSVNNRTTNKSVSKECLKLKA